MFRMRVKIFFLYFLSFILFSACQNALNFNGWYIKNNSSKDVLFTINDDEYTITSNSELIIDYPETASFEIAKDYFVSNSNPQFYVKDNSLFKETKITDIPSYNYCIQNNTASDIVVKYFDNWYQVSKELNVPANSSIDFIIYDSKSSVKIYNLQNEEVFFTEAILNHIYIFYVN